MIRVATTDADLEVWAAIKNAVMPNEPLSVAELRVYEKPDRLLLLAELDGAPAGCAIAAPSSFAGCCFFGPRVLPALRRRGVGTALLRAASAHARELGRGELSANAEVGDEAALAFAARYGFVEIDRQVELVRALGEEAAPHVPEGVELVSVAARPELLERAYEVAVATYRDFALPEPVAPEPFEQWAAEEGRLPEGSFVALVDGEVVGYSGLVPRDPTPEIVEQGLTAVRRAWRRRGIATTLKRAVLRAAAEAGFREIVTWTQGGNEAMIALNESLGFRVRSGSITLRGPLL